MSVVLVCTLMSLFLLGGRVNERRKEKLEAFCKFKGYEIVDYYEDARINAKTGNHRPEFERLKDDICLS